MPGDPPGVCAMHMTAGMVDVTQRYCEMLGCEARPTFADPGEETPSLCSEHKTEEMVDISDSLCQHPGCAKNALFALRHEAAARFCTSHKQADMVNMEGRHCIVSKCKGKPKYSQDGCEESGPFYCMTHQEVGMVMLGKKRRKH